jgi:hypothetical protein
MEEKRRLTGQEFVPCLKGLGLEEVGRVVGSESLVDFEFGDLCWH